MKVPHASSEQRREARAEVLSGNLLVVDLISHPAPRTHGIVLNISKGGMAVQTFRPLVQGRVAKIHPSLPTGILPVCEGLVAWGRPGGLAGIRFLNAPLQTLPELRQGTEQDLSNQSSDSALSLSIREGRFGANAFDAALHLLACSAMSLTGATGAAIALGDSSGMQCRASAGSAPDVGTQIRPDTGLSGQCLRTGVAVICSDAGSDSRVNAGAAQQMDSRSFAIVPITVAENTVGLLEVFSRDTKFFSDRHLNQLQPLVAVLAVVIKEQSAPESEASQATVPGMESVGEEESQEDVQSTALTPLTSSPTILQADADSPALTHSAARSRFADRSLVVASLAILAVLLIFLALVAWFASRNRAASPRNSTSSIGAEPPNVDTSEQAVVPASMPVISFDPPVTDQKVGATFSVNVVLKGANNVWSAPMRILYDSRTLQLLTVRSGGLFDRGGHSAVLVYRVDPSAGRINISISRPLSAPGISGQGAVFTLMFLSKAMGMSRLRVDQTGLRDTSTKVVSVNSSDANVIISRFTNPAQGVSEPGAAEVGLAGDASGYSGRPFGAAAFVLKGPARSSLFFAAEALQQPRHVEGLLQLSSRPL